MPDRANIEVKKSPRDMAIRLNYAGMRDINLLADMTNYLMLEMGQPMHAFDNDIVKGITVIEAREKLETDVQENLKKAGFNVYSSKTGKVVIVVP